MIFNKRQPKPQERRLSPRRAVSAQAAIKLAGQRALPCVTVDVSDSGARLKLGGGVLLPERFVVSIPSAATERMARLIWRSTEMIGVQFVA